MSHDGRVFVIALLAGLPAVLATILLLWLGDYSLKVRWTISVAVAGCWLGGALALRERVVRPLQTLGNLVAALREGDFSIRGRGAGDDALGHAVSEVNALGRALREERYGAVEAGELLAQVMGAIDVAVLAFDENRRLRVANAAAARLLGASIDNLIGKEAAALGLAPLLDGEAPRIVDTLSDNETTDTAPDTAPTHIAAAPRGPWLLRRGAFRREGRPHSLVVLTDIKQALRDEERQAFERLVRVLGHEINNSLAPIQSIAENLRALAERTVRPDDWEEDLARGLAVIQRRSASLGRFLAAYTRLHRLPPPRLAPVAVAAWISRVAELEDRARVRVVPGPDIIIRADGDQLDQLLINLVRNAVEAVAETGGEIGGGVTVTWSLDGPHLDISIIDEGPGLGDTANLFVPFFTTKPQGSGIGLVLARQIAEAHGGTLTLANRRDAGGCEARLRLPLR